MILNSFFDEMEKIAISRVTREIVKGTLSPGVEVAARKFMRSPDVMARGLARGSENIARRLGYGIHTGGIFPTLRGAKKTLGEAAREVAHKRPGLKELPEAFFSAVKKAPSAKETANTALATVLAPALGGGGTIPQLKSIIMQPGVKKFRDIAGKAGKNMTKSERNYLTELIKRHEVDEARAALRSTRQWSLPGRSVPLTGGHLKIPGGAHLSPDVLLREAYHTRLAPERVRKAMTSVREATRETPGMADLAGFRYGREAMVPGSREFRRASRALSAGSKAMPRWWNLYLSPEMSKSVSRFSDPKDVLSALLKLRTS